MTTPNVLFAGKSDDWAEYQTCLENSFSKLGITANLTNSCSRPEDIDYIVYAPNGPLKDFSPYTNLKAVLSLWAGVESFQDNATLRAPLARMVDQGLSQGMAEWVLGHTMRYHLGMDRHLFGQDGIWRAGSPPPLAKNRKIGILGLGELGVISAKYLVQTGFQTSGWSRRQKSVEGVTCYSGSDGLVNILSQSEILILLLPLTHLTKGIISEKTLALLPKGAFILNPGRGPLIDDTALLSALDNGRVAHATLDVFAKEPLPKEHPYWAHPKVTVTPHIASETRPETASDAIAENIRRGQDGRPFLYLVDRKEGY